MPTYSRNTVLLATDFAGSVLVASDATNTNVIAYTPYGGSPRAGNPGTRLLYNGEFRESSTAHYALGMGYRLYNPALMQFMSPDSSAYSPFGEGGLNAYVYCGGNPVNRKDSSGHFFTALRNAFRSNSPRPGQQRAFQRELDNRFNVNKREAIHTEKGRGVGRGRGAETLLFDIERRYVQPKGNKFTIITTGTTGDLAFTAEQKVNVNYKKSSYTLGKLRITRVAPREDAYFTVPAKADFINLSIENSSKGLSVHKFIKYKSLPAGTIIQLSARLRGQ